MRGKVTDREVGPAELAEWLGVTEQNLANLVRDGAVKKTSRGVYQLKESILLYCGRMRRLCNARAGVADDGASKAEGLEENTRLKKATRELTEMRRDALARKLIPIDDIVDAWGAIVRNVRQTTLAIPQRLQAEMPHLPAEDVETMRRVMREILKEVSGVVSDTPPLGEGAEIEPDFVPPRIKGRKPGRPPGPSVRLRP